MEFAEVRRRGTDSIKWDDVARRFGREGLLPLWVADMDMAAPQGVREAIARRVEHPVYGYTRYGKELFAAIAWWYRERFGWEIDPEWIVPDHGVVVSINTAIAALTQPGDGVVIQTPIYPPFFDAVRHNGRRTLENRLVYASGRYRIDWDDLETQLSQARMMLLCSPHNPTTRAWDREELTRLVQLCRRYDVTIVSDEIHSDIVYEREHIPVGRLEDALERTLTLHAPSKTFNVAGLNTSYAIIPDPQRREAYRREYARIGLPHGNPFGIEALKAAYTPDGAAWVDRLKAHLQSNLRLVHTYLREHLPQIVPVPTEATFLVWLDCRALRLDDKELMRLFVDQAGLALNPGISFGRAGSGFMRLNIGTSEATLLQALERLKTAIEEAGR
jgi:cystathionine beta-lyase